MHVFWYHLVHPEQSEIFFVGMDLKIIFGHALEGFMSGRFAAQNMVRG